MKMSEIFKKLYESKLTDKEAKNLMTGDDAIDELLDLFNQGMIDHRYYGIKE